MNPTLKPGQLAKEREMRKAGKEGSHHTDRPARSRKPEYTGGLAPSVNDACQRWLEKRGLAIPSADYRLGFNLARSREFKAARAAADAKRPNG